MGGNGNLPGGQQDGRGSGVVRVRNARDEHQHLHVHGDAPEYATLNNASATITPTLSSSNSVSATAPSATLTATAGHNNSITNAVPAKAISGNTLDYTVSFSCGLNVKDYTGDLGVSGIVLTTTLPTNFDYQSARLSYSLPGTLSYNAATRVLTYTDPTGKSCGNPPLNISNFFSVIVTGKASTNGVADPVGSKICFTASGTWTYIDGVAGSGTTTQVCSTVINLATTVTKATTAPSTLSNIGQFAAADGGANAPIPTRATGTPLAPRSTTTSPPQPSRPWRTPGSPTTSATRCRASQTWRTTTIRRTRREPSARPRRSSPP